MLTKAQLKKIEEIIKRRFLSFTYEILGESVLSEDEINLLKRAGLLRSSVRNFTGDAYTLGRIVASIDRSAARKLGFEEVLKMAEKIPLTSIEKKAIGWANEHTGKYIRGLFDDMTKEVGAATARVSGSALRAVQDQVVSAVKNRKTTNELKTALFDAIDDRYRDWQRVASTEMTNAVQHGIYADIRENHGADQLVYKRPSPDSCKHCRKVYLEDDDITPRVFRLSELADSNIGKKAHEWEPTIGAVHPFCQCQLQVIPEGYDFTKKRVILQSFTKDDKKYKNGSIITEAEYESFDSDERSNVGYAAILENTGTTAIKKSSESYSISDMDSYDCLCSY